MPAVVDCGSKSILGDFRGTVHTARLNFHVKRMRNLHAVCLSTSSNTGTQISWDQPRLDSSCSKDGNDQVLAKGRTVSMQVYLPFDLLPWMNVIRFSVINFQVASTRWYLKRDAHIPYVIDDSKPLSSSTAPKHVLIFYTCLVTAYCRKEKGADCCTRRIS